jgi:hypothetical protein
VPFFPSSEHNRLVLVIWILFVCAKVVFYSSSSGFLTKGVFASVSFTSGGGGGDLGYFLFFFS